MRVDRGRRHDRLLRSDACRLRCGARRSRRVPILGDRAQVERRFRGAAFAWSTAFVGICRESLGRCRAGTAVGRPSRRNLTRHRTPVQTQPRNLLLVPRTPTLLVPWTPTLLVRRTRALLRHRPSIRTEPETLLVGDRPAVLAGPATLVLGTTTLETGLAEPGILLRTRRPDRTTRLRRTAEPALRTRPLPTVPLRRHAGTTRVLLRDLPTTAGTLGWNRTRRNGTGRNRATLIAGTAGTAGVTLRLDRTTAPLAGLTLALGSVRLLRSPPCRRPTGAAGRDRCGRHPAGTLRMPRIHRHPTPCGRRRTRGTVLTRTLLPRTRTRSGARPRSGTRTRTRTRARHGAGAGGGTRPLAVDRARATTLIAAALPRAVVDAVVSVDGPVPGRIVTRAARFLVPSLGLILGPRRSRNRRWADRCAASAATVRARADRRGAHRDGACRDAARRDGTDGCGAGRHRAGRHRADRRGADRGGAASGRFVDRGLHGLSASGVARVALTGEGFPLPGDLVDPRRLVVPAVRARPGAPTVHRAANGRPGSWRLSVTAYSTLSKNRAVAGRGPG